MNSPPSPELVFETINAYQKSAALKAGVELDVFTAIAEGNQTASQIAGRCQASERGVRILCDYLTIIGFLSKSENRYQLTPDSGAFLNRQSPAYMGSAMDFLLNPMLMEAFRDVAGSVRKGGTLMEDEGTVTSDHPIWVSFARAMMPMMRMPAQVMAEAVEVENGRPVKLLDIAAGHGIFGIAFAERYPNVEVTALDWPNVLEVAKENARNAGVSDRHRLLPGSAFEVELRDTYDLVLITNFLHHFDPPTCESLLRKIHAALNTGGRVVTLEFIPNDDRISPPIPAAFSMIMLNTTPSGDAYTFKELEAMFKNAGFPRNEFRSLVPAPQQIVISHKDG